MTFKTAAGSVVVDTLGEVCRDVVAESGAAGAVVLFFVMKAVTASVGPVGQGSHGATKGF